MGFKRARSDEQKRERLESIMRAADRLLDRHPYREITMTMIADEVGFSRANLGHYVATKEEAFLLLYLHDLMRLREELAGMVAEGVADGDAREAGGGTADGDVEGFAARLAASCADCRNVGRVGALLSAIIETNIDVERLTACKRTMRELALEGARLLSARFAFLGPDEAMELVMALTQHVAGLYPGTHPLDVQRAALRASGFPDPAPDEFERALRRLIVVQLAGYRALAKA